MKKFSAFTLAEVFHPAEQSRRIVSRIIRVVAGVTSCSTSRAGFANAHTAHLSHNNSLDCCVRQSQKFGFTLAEVLITLGIIGVVAALTMPSLIANHKKQVVETKLKRYYSTMNQAIIRSELDNGPKENWNFELSKTGKGYDEETLKKFYNTYYKNYIKVLKTDFFINPYDNNQHMRFYFADGSISLMSWYGADYWYCIDQKSADNPVVGKNCFPFALMPASEEKGQQRTKYFRNKGLEPYIVPKTWDGTREGLKENPLNYTKLIQLNGWKIPEDYPLKF